MGFFFVTLARLRLLPPPSIGNDFFFFVWPAGLPPRGRFAPFPPSPAWEIDLCSVRRPFSLFPLGLPGLSRGPAPRPPSTSEPVPAQFCAKFFASGGRRSFFCEGHGSPINGERLANSLFSLLVFSPLAHRLRSIRLPFV